jgi:DNA repair protein RecO
VSVVTTPSVLLRSFNYRETSQILRFYTLDLGLIGVMAKGVRRRNSRGRGGLDTFSRGELTVYVRPTRDLQTFKEFNIRESGQSLGRDVLRFAAASILAELVLVHAETEPSGEIFECLTKGLKNLENVGNKEVAFSLLSEGWLLISLLGYKPQLDPCVKCRGHIAMTERVQFDFKSGDIVCSNCSNDMAESLMGRVLFEQLRALLDGFCKIPITDLRAHLQLLHDFTVYHIAGSKGLRSFHFFTSLMFESSAFSDDDDLGAPTA